MKTLGAIVMMIGIAIAGVGWLAEEARLRARRRVLRCVYCGTRMAHWSGTRGYCPCCRDSMESRP